jgi:hypothetical protein
LTGNGSESDPVRPEYIADPNAAPSRSGILAWSLQLTDDKKMAIVQFVAADRKAFQSILADKRPEIRVFEIGKDGRNVVEAELKKFKKDFNLDTMRLRVQ